MSAATEKQIAYIESLKDEVLRDTHRCYRQLKGAAATLKVINAALAIGMPAPVDSRDASTQIEALQLGTLTGYYKAHRDVYATLAPKMVSIIGQDGSKFDPRAAESVAALRAYFAGLAA